MLEEKKDSTKEELGSDTEGKRQYIVGGPDPYGMYFVKLDGGGRVPASLEHSRWADAKEVEAACIKLNNNI